MKLTDYGTYYSITWLYDGSKLSKNSTKPKMNAGTLYIPKCQINSVEDLEALMPSCDDTHYMFVNELRHGHYHRQLFRYDGLELGNKGNWIVPKL